MAPTAFPALLTPFDADGELTVGVHASNVEQVAASGVFDGILLAGSTGQGPLLEPGERRTLTSVARDRAPDAHLMVGVMAESVRGALTQVEEAATGGADSVLVLTPVTLSRSDGAAHLRYLTAIAQRSPLGVLVYSVPRNTGYAVDEHVVVEISEHPNVVGSKDSGGDIERIGRIVDATPDGFRVYNGSSRTALAALRIGCEGLIMASCNYAPTLVARILEDDNEAQAELGNLVAVVEEGGVGGVTTAARMVGFVDGGIPRPPLQATDPLVLNGAGVASMLATPGSRG